MRRHAAQQLQYEPRKTGRTVSHPAFPIQVEDWPIRKLGLDLAGQSQAFHRMLRDDAVVLSNEREVVGFAGMPGAKHVLDCPCPLAETVSSVVESQAVKSPRTAGLAIIIFVSIRRQPGV